MRRMLERALSVAVESALQAGARLRADFHRPGGPRGGGDKADADTEAEREIRSRLTAAFPRWGYRGEETGVQPGEPGEPIWLVDPNDGTRDYLAGRGLHRPPARRPARPGRRVRVRVSRRRR